MKTGKDIESNMNHFVTRLQVKTVIRTHYHRGIRRSTIRFPNNIQHCKPNQSAWKASILKQNDAINTKNPENSKSQI